jgi:hypothetical protein
MKLTYAGTRYVEAKTDLEIPLFHTGVFVIEVPVEDVIARKLEIEREMLKRFCRRPKWITKTTEDVVDHMAKNAVNSLLTPVH